MHIHRGSNTAHPLANISPRFRQNSTQRSTEKITVQLTCVVVKNNTDINVNGTVTEVSTQGFRIVLDDTAKNTLNKNDEVQCIITYGASYVNIAGKICEITDNNNLILECLFLKREQEILLQAIMLCQL